MSARAFCVLVASALSVDARAFVVLDDPGCPRNTEIIDGSSQLVRLEEGFTPAKVQAIEGAAEMWRACSTCVVRGAAWEFEIGEPVAAGALNNGRPEVFERDQEWFTNRGHPEDVVAAYINGGTLCARVSQDIVIDNEEEFKFTVPSEGSQTIWSLQQVVAHEFGHWFGLEHEGLSGVPPAFVTLMNEGGLGQPSGGDLGGKFRIHESEINALRTFKGASGTQTQLMLGQFWSSTFTVQCWDLFSNNQWERGETVQISPLLPVTVHTAGTANITVPVEWFLSLNTICSQQDYSLYREVKTYGFNQQAPLVPDLFVPADMPTGIYHLCAKVDPDLDHAEPNEDDNTVFLHHTVAIF